MPTRKKRNKGLKGREKLRGKKAKKYVSSCPEVLEDTIVKKLVDNFQSKTPTKTRPNERLPVEVWETALRGHPDQEWVQKLINKIDCQADEGGFSISEQPIKCESDNMAEYPATVQHIIAGLKKLEKLHDRGYIWGPFSGLDKVTDEITKHGEVHLWPLFYKEEFKSTGQVKIRLLSNFSDQQKGKSFNDAIDDKEKTVKYISVVDVVRRIVNTKSRWMWAIDALDAYYRVPIRVRDIRHCGLRICNMIFFFTCLVMGMSTACKLYTEFADTIMWIILNDEDKARRSVFHAKSEKNSDLVALLMHYIDDFMGCAKTEKEAKEQQKYVLWWFKKLGVPTQGDKITEVGQLVNYLGFLFNCRDYELGVMEKRVEKYKENCQKLLGMAYTKRKVTVHQMQIFVGQMRSMQMVYHYMIPMVRRLEELSTWGYREQFKELKHRHKVALEVIMVALKDAEKRAMPFKWLLHRKDAGDVEMFTDAATSWGVGGYEELVKGRHFRFMWKELSDWELMTKPDITFMELMGLVMAVWLLGEQHTGKALKMWCDNWGACMIVAKKAACLRRRDLNDLVAVLCKIATKYRIYFWAAHIDGEENVLADALSRWDSEGKEAVARKEIETLELREEGMKFVVGIDGKKVTVLEAAKTLMQCWTRHSDYVLMERKKQQNKCQCKRQMEGSNAKVEKLCNKMNRDLTLIKSRSVPKLNRKERRASKFFKKR